MLPINRQPEPAVVRRFARIWFPLFVVFLAGVLWWRLDSLVVPGVVLGIGALLAISAAVSLETARTIFVGLQTITYPIGLVISTLALAFLFYGMFTPLGWVMRMAGRDPLRLKARNERSNWLPYQQDDDPAAAFKQY
jgi:hypothetical protein